MRRKLERMAIRVVRPGSGAGAAARGRYPSHGACSTRPTRPVQTMAIAEAQVYMPQAPRPKYRPLEDERWLAFFLLVPTLILLGLFIAYPFVKGVELSVTDTRVGVPGQFVGLANFVKLWNDSIFRIAVYNTLLYTVVTTVFKLALGLWLAMLLNRHFRGKAFVRAFILLPFIIPTVLSTFAWKWMFDPTFSVLNWLLFQLGADHRAHQLARRSRSGDDLDHDRQCLARRAVLRDQPARRAADDQPRTARGGGDRRRPAVEPLPARHLAAAAAGDDGGRAVLGDPDLRRLPARLRADRRRAGQRHPPVRHLRLPDRRRHRPAERGRGDLAGDLPDPVAGRDHPAPLHPPGGDAYSHDRRSTLAALGLLLPPADAVHRRAAVPVLLDDRHHGPAGRRAVPAVERGQLHAVLDLQSDARSLPRPVDRDAVQHLDVEHDADRAGRRR